MRTDVSPFTQCASRRVLLQALAAAGVGSLTGGVLVACGSTTPGPGSTSTPSTSGNGTSNATSQPESGTATVPDPGTQGTSTPVIATREVPVGTARVVELPDLRIVVAQPTAGTFVAFSTICTHEGTPVNVLGDGLELACPNHGSRFSAADGSVERGPAASPLAEVPVRVEGDQLVLA